MLYVNPLVVLQDAWSDCLAEDRADELIKLADVIARKAHKNGQRGFVLDSSKRIAVLCGRGAGKTTAAEFRLARRLLKQAGAQCLYLASSRDQARKLLWEPLKALFARLNIAARFYEDRLQCVMQHNGASLTLDGANDRKDIEKYRGIPHDEVVIDECASMKPSLLDNLINQIIIPRLGDRKGTLVLIGTPGRVFLGPFYEITRTGSDQSRPYAERDDVVWEGWSSWSFHAWNLKDSAEAGIDAAINLWAAALEEKKNKLWSDDNPTWLREYLGRWARDNTETVYHYRPHDESGQPWNQWNPERTPFGLAKLPEHLSDWSFVYGIDFGVKDPTAIQVFAYSLTDPAKTLYHVYEFEKRGLNIRQIAAQIIGDSLDIDTPGGIVGQTDWPDAMVGDASSEAILKELADVYGIRISPAPRKWGDKLAAIETFNGDLIDGRIKIMMGSKLEEQLTLLQWVSREDGQIREDPGAENDCADAALYCRGAAKHLLSGPAPEVQKPSFRQPPKAPREDFADLQQEPDYFDPFSEDEAFSLY